MFALPMNQVGPPWAGNQLANYVTELVTACEDRAQELGFEALTRPIGCYAPLQSIELPSTKHFKPRSRVCAR